MLRDKINSGIVSLLSGYVDLPSRPLDFEGFVEKWTGFFLTKICEEEGHDALFIKSRYRDIGIVRHQITPCKRCGKGKEKDVGTHGPPSELLFDDRAEDPKKEAT